MTITQAWADDEKTILRVEYGETWTWEEFHATWNEVIAILKNTPHPVYILVVNPQRAYTPRGNAITQFGIYLRPLHQHAALIAVVMTNDQLSRSIVSILQKIHRPLAGKFALVNSVEAAYTAIEAQRARAHS